MHGKLCRPGWGRAGASSFSARGRVHGERHPGFRGVDGLYRQKYAYPPETILSDVFFRSHTEEFYRFYREKIVVTDARPNAAHEKLAQWEREAGCSPSSPKTSTACTRRQVRRRSMNCMARSIKTHCVRCGRATGWSMFCRAKAAQMRMWRRRQAGRGALRRIARQRRDRGFPRGHRRRRPADRRRHVVDRLSRRGPHRRLRGPSPRPSSTRPPPGATPARIWCCTSPSRRFLPACKVQTMGVPSSQPARSGSSGACASQTFFLT